MAFMTGIAAVRRLLTGALGFMAVLALPAGGAAAQEYDYYRLNGATMPIEMQQMMMLSGFAPGDYYIDEVGNFGVVGQPPMMNVDGGPPHPGGNGQAAPAAPQTDAPQTAPPPATPQGAPQSSAPQPSGADGGLTGTRMFWMFSSRIGSGGSSGYIHLCPGGVFYSSSEASFSVGGEYDSARGGNRAWAGGAGVRQGGGQWAVQGDQLVLNHANGNVQNFNVAEVRRGTRWWVGQFQYAAEHGTASCG